MFRPTIVPGLQLYGGPDHISGSYEDDGKHAGHRLEPCPFCGSTRLELMNTHTPSYWVVCHKCDAEAHGNLPAGAGDRIITDRTALLLHLRAIRSAVRKWNKRAIEPAATPVDNPLSPGTKALPLLMAATGYAEALPTEEHGNRRWMAVGASEQARCNRAPTGWICSRTEGHTGPCAAHRASDVDDLRQSVGEVLSAKLYKLMDNGKQAFDACDAYNIDMILDEIMPLIDAAGSGRVTEGA